MVRKSPYKHDVSGHNRAGRWVETYKRGKGRKPRTRSRPRRVVAPPKAGQDIPYAVSLFYPDEKTQSFNVDSDNWTEAAQQGFTRTKVVTTPEKVRIRLVDKR